MSIELIIELLLMPLVAFFIGLSMVLVMRKIAARLQRGLSFARYMARNSSQPAAATSTTRMGRTTLKMRPDRSISASLLA